MHVFTNQPVGKAFGKFILTTMFLSVAVTIYVFGYSGGITGKTQKSGDEGCSCHGSALSAVVSVVIDGPASLIPGQTGTYNVTISGGPLVAAGTNIAASAGTLVPGAGLRLASSELTHQEPKTSSNGKVVYSFTYTAPVTEGSVTLYANGNSVNLDGTNGNDQWNFAQDKTVSVSSATDIESEKYNLNYDLKQNYPNPFNPSTTIFYQIPQAGNVELKVFSITGTEVASLVNAYKPSGSYAVEFNASTLTSGVYFYKISVNNFSEIKKMVLLR
ncbi:MAG: T9SS type A sorting domain-containing protein [Ignavibacteriaceae bacterium]|nr:T9SS type A sorting domain-containing protein [Ignavibacteriaceae bacterium]